MVGAVFSAQEAIRNTRVMAITVQATHNKHCPGLDPGPHAIGTSDTVFHALDPAPGPGSESGAVHGAIFVV